MRFKHWSVFLPNFIRSKINDVVIDIEVGGIQRQLISARFICELINIHRRLIQNLVRNNNIKMYNGLLDLSDVLRLFPDFRRIRIV